jgi:hypothetical protein
VLAPLSHLLWRNVVLVERKPKVKPKSEVKPKPEVKKVPIKTKVSKPIKRK